MTQAKDSVKIGNEWKVLISILLIAAVILLIITVTTTRIPEGYVDQEAVDLAVSNAVNSALVDVTEKDNLITELQNQLNPQENETTDNVTDVVTMGIGFLVDEIFLSSPTSEEIYSDRELNLFDGKVEFDGDDFDAEETLKIDGIEVLANGHDYDGNVFMNVYKDSIEYKLEFESKLNESAINEDETLVFNFLGKQLEISNWNGNEITFLQGDKYVLIEGESLAIGEDTIVLEFASDDSAHFSVNDVLKEVDEGQIRTIGDLQIKLEYSFETTSYRTGQVSILVAEDIEKVITDADEYEEDSAWEWAIDTESLGLVLVEDFDEVDEDGDEDFQAMGVTESICLPNNYICLMFNGLSVEDEYEYEFSLDTRSSIDYVRVDGDFINGLNDLNRIYIRINDSLMFDRDLEEVTGDIELGNSDSLLIANVSGIAVEDFLVNYDLDSSNVGSDDEDYLTDYGILVMNPDDSSDDQNWNIVLPEEQLEASFSILM